MIQVPPLNDDFAEAQVVDGANVVANANNALATAEPGEPTHDGIPGGHSVWWSWTAPFTGTFAISTTGSTFDTVLAIYRGTSLSDLALEASNHHFADSQVRLRGQAGIVYWIAVDGYEGETGDAALNIRSVTSPPNDDFVNRAQLVGITANVPLTNRYATMEPAEPNHAGGATVVGGKSVWWTWQAPPTSLPTFPVTLRRSALRVWLPEILS